MASWPPTWVVSVYLVVMLGLMVMGIFRGWPLGDLFLLIFGPLFGWGITLQVMMVYLVRRYVWPARREWKTLHPPAR